MSAAGELSGSHRERLCAAGLDPAVLDDPTWRLVTEPMPDWWSDRGNALYLADGAWLPDHVLVSLGLIAVSDVLIVVGAPMEWLSSLLVGGDSATVFLGRQCVLTAGELYCGSGSSIVLHGPLVATRGAVVDARNGGSIVAGADGLWAADVYVATDDMHRLEDRATGERLNPFGAHVRIGEHVWLGRDVVVTGDCTIGDGSVVGMRSLVRGQDVPGHSVVAGTPARVVRKDATWSHADLP